MKSKRWILIDTETTGLAAPIYVVEIGAQLMEGWSPSGPSFRRLINQNAAIPPEASRVHGYTKEILERDGESAVSVYSAFAKYVQGLPIVAFNLAYDLEQVLMPEWARLGKPCTYLANALYTATADSPSRSKISLVYPCTLEASGGMTAFWLIRRRNGGPEGLQPSIN